MLLLAAPSAAVGRAQPVDPHIGAGAGRKAVLQGPRAGPSRSSRSFRSFPSRLSPRVHHCCCFMRPPGPGLSGCLLALLALIVALLALIVAANNKRAFIIYGHPKSIQCNGKLMERIVEDV